MAQDKLIKSGQLTFSRILFLALCGGLIFMFVAMGGKFLSIGYLLVTLAICILLFLIAIDYGVKMDRVDASGQPQSPVLESGLPTSPVNASVAEPKVKRRVQKTVKRRR